MNDKSSRPRLTSKESVVHFIEDDDDGDDGGDGAMFPKKVRVKAVFKKMGEIDTAKECFTAEVVIQAKWREETLDGINEEDIKKLDYSELWNPKLVVSNLLTEHKDVTSHTVIFPKDNDAAYVLLQKRVKGCFMENLELQMFPLDIQDLTVTLTSELTSAQVRLVPDSGSVVNTGSFVDEQEWKLRSKVRTESGETEDIVLGGRSIGREHPFLNFKCTAERRYLYFLWNFAFILVFICFMCLTIFSVECKFPQNRLQLTFILLLTTIALKTNINSTLPKISYLTLMDKYFLGSWVIQCLMCVWHAVVGSLLLDRTDVVNIDRAVLALFSLLLVVFQSFCACYAFRKLRSRKSAFDQFDGTPRPTKRNGSGEGSILNELPLKKYSSTGHTTKNGSSSPLKH